MKNLTYEQWRTLDEIKRTNESIARDPGKSFFKASFIDALRYYPQVDFDDDSEGKFNEMLEEVGLPGITFSAPIDVTSDNFPDEDDWAERGYESLEDAWDAYEELIGRCADEVSDYLKNIYSEYRVIPDDVVDDLELLLTYKSWDGAKNIRDLWIALEFSRDALRELLKEAPCAEAEYLDAKYRKKGE